ncbi:MAG: hypothetical protein AVDCRST_MAG57-3377 [uncultured Blastococcus sp.]|uniref:Uncharacterized protein n=1 Tax=uncultured Blastococcus sp. TaxID=217144 RepID=A0A6J4JCB7_9ACTN|nr:MAG: hypothetical protein AVDCRST_MAG57-3377 [uncultured Blastococcus sp.]
MGTASEILWSVVVSSRRARRRWRSLIAGTSSVAHLCEKVAAAGLTLPEDEPAVLEGIAGAR